MGVTITHEPCEVCGSKNNLAVWSYDDGSSTKWCYTEGCSNKETKRRPDDAQFTFFPDRLTPKDTGNLLSIQTLSAYDVRIDREGYTKVMFVYRQPTGQVVKAKCRNYNLSKDEDGHFYNVGKTKQPCLYGKESRRGTRCIITEGEWDALAAREMTGYTAVSVDNGNAGGIQAVIDDIEYLESFDKVYICLDNDPQGVKSTEKILEILPLAIPVLIPMLPKEDETYTKDAWDMLKAGYGAEFRAAVESAQPRTPDFILKPSELMTRVKNFLRNPDQNKGWDTGLPGLTDMLGGYRESEITMLIGDPGKGKSTFARFAIGAAVRANKRVLYISLEDEPERAAVRFMEMYFNKRLINAEEQVTDEELAEMGQIYMDNTIQMTDCSLLSPDDLERQVRYAVIQNDVKFIVVDHLTIAAQTMMEGTLLQNVTNFLGRINTLKKKYKVHFLVISHNHRPPVPQKNDDIGITNDPIPTERDGYGGAVIEQMTDNYLAIRMMRSGAIELYLLKNRLWKVLGKSTLKYQNGNYTETGYVITKKDDREAKTESTEVQGRDTKRLGGSDLGEVSLPKENPPVIETPENKDREVDEQCTGLSAAKRLLSGNKRIPYRRVDGEDASTQGAVPI